VIDEKAFAQLVERRGNMVYKLAFVYMKSEFDAEDVYQNVFERFIKYEPEFDSPEHEKAWFIVTTINVCRSMLSSSWQRHTRVLDDVEWEQILSKTSRERMTHEDGALIEAVLKLPDNYRIVVQLFYYEDYSVREIAELLKIKEGTVTTQLNRARRKIKKMLDRGEC
jgi:RNA polymerase sigma-70 factor (ECF subfamily)